MKTVDIKNNENLKGEIVDAFADVMNEHLEGLRELYLESGIDGINNYCPAGICYEIDNGTVYFYAAAVPSGNVRAMFDFVQEVADAIRDGIATHDGNEEDFRAHVERETWKYDDFTDMSAEELMGDMLGEILAMA